MNSALADIRTMYLRRYYYQSTSGVWKALNVILPSTVSGYGYLPFIIVIGSGIYAINVVGGAVGGSLSPDGITYSKIIGADVSVSAKKKEAISESNLICLNSLMHRYLLSLCVKALL